MKLITNCAQDENFIDPAVSWVELLDNAKTIRPSKQVLVLIQFFFGEGEVKVRSELEDRFVDQKKKKTPKKKKKGRKIKEREKQTKNTALHDM